MCQAYEGEARMYDRLLGNETLKGFAAAMRGQPKKSNPHKRFQKDYEEAWNHGWGCWRERILICQLDIHYREKGDYAAAEKARKAFKKTGKLPKELLALLPKVENQD